jgi:hypothetical protein
MPIPRPPRREPRVLAIVASGRRCAFAVVDPWEVRSTGSITVPTRSLPAALRRIIRREQPTLAVADRPGLTAALDRAARGLCPGVDARRLRVPPTAIARDLFPELPLFAPTPGLERAARLAIAAVLFAHIPTRPYAPRRPRAPHDPA